MQREAQGLGGDDLSKRPNEILVWLELPTRVGRFRFLDGLIDLGDGCGEGKTPAWIEGHAKNRPCWSARATKGDVGDQGDRS